MCTSRSHFQAKEPLPDEELLWTELLESYLTCCWQTLHYTLTWTESKSRSSYHFVFCTWFQCIMLRKERPFNTLFGMDWRGNCVCIEKSTYISWCWYYWILYQNKWSEFKYLYWAYSSQTCFSRLFKGTVGNLQEWQYRVNEKVKYIGIHEIIHSLQGRCYLTEV